MKVLLDTHVLIWWLRDKHLLGDKARLLIADKRADVWVSIASFWETAVKASVGKIDQVASVLWREAEEQKFGVLGLTFEHLAALEALRTVPGHEDPFDRLIVAQAIAEDALLVTGDRSLRAYPARLFRAT